jgi:hypothetical protein
VVHLQENGFEVALHLVPNVAAVQAEYGISPELRGCHTAQVAGYVVEGHVPADLIKRLLEEKPDVAGIAVPGMIMGPPGMEGPVPRPYDVLTFDRDGKSTIYESR